MSPGEWAHVRMNPAEKWWKLFQRLPEKAQERRIVFVVGAALARDGGGGVANVAELTELVHEQCGIAGAGKTSAARYQDAFGRLKDEESAEHVDWIVRCGVLQACRLPARDPRLVKAQERGERQGSACKQLQELNENELIGAWYLPAGVRLLADTILRVNEARLRTPNPPKAPVIITTNFDGLIEVALGLRNIRYQSRHIVRDDYPQSWGDDVEVWHVHGYWCGEPTLHTPGQYTLRRESLEQALLSAFRRAEVTVMAYGGWQDQVFDTLTEMLAKGRFDQGHAPSVRWGFHEGDAEDAAEKNGHVLRRFENTIARSYVSYYYGVDAHGAPKDLLVPNPTHEGAVLGGDDAVTIEHQEQKLRPAADPTPTQPRADARPGPADAEVDPPVSDPGGGFAQPGNDPSTPIAPRGADGNSIAVSTAPAVLFPPSPARSTRPLHIAFFYASSVFLVGLIVLSVFGLEVLASQRFLVYFLMAFSAAGFVSSVGADVSIRGRLPFKFLSGGRGPYLRAGGAAAMFIGTLVLSSVLFPLRSGAEEEGSKVAMLDVVPDAVSGHYASDGPGGHATAVRNDQGWTVSLSAAAAEPGGGSWSGYCWDFAPVDARRYYHELHVVMADSEIPAEVEMKLERPDNKYQDRVVRFIGAGDLAIDLDAYPAVRQEIGRFCTMLRGQAATARQAKFTLTRVYLR